jgi:hypothetical protein
MTGEASAQVMHVMDGHLRAQDIGHKRHLAVDTAGLLLAVVINAASVQDRGGAGRCCGMRCDLVVSLASRCSLY